MSGADARKKVWELLDALRVCQTLKEAAKIQRGLSQASSFFTPSQIEGGSRPLRILWEITAASTAGVAMGAITGPIVQAARSVPGLLQDFGGALFGRGAFDLANQVRRKTAEIRFDALTRLLTEAENDKLRSA